MLTIEQIKTEVKAGTAVGKSFQNKAGSVGTVKAQVSVRGKPVAEMTCTKEGCATLHDREISDWHQSHRCSEHPANRSGKSKKKSGKTPEDYKAELERANADLLKYAKDNGVDLSKAEPEAEETNDE